MQVAFSVHLVANIKIISRPTYVHIQKLYELLIFSTCYSSAVCHFYEY